MCAEGNDDDHHDGNDCACGGAAGTDGNRRAYPDRGHRGQSLRGRRRSDHQSESAGAYAGIAAHEHDYDRDDRYDHDGHDHDHENQRNEGEETFSLIAPRARLHYSGVCTSAVVL